MGPARRREDRLLPGYGWIFGMGDGTSNVGLGVLNTSAAFKELDWREVLKAWCASMPEDWGYTPENMTCPIRGAALPMAFNRQPHYTKGLLLVGDAGGMVNPFNGEGIAYAMESGQIAADVIVQAHARATPAQRELALHALPEGPQGHLRRLLHAGPRLREAHRQPEGHEDRDAARPDAPAADEVHAEDAGQPDRPDGRRRDGPHHQRPEEGGPEGLSARDGPAAVRAAAERHGAPRRPASQDGPASDRAREGRRDGTRQLTAPLPESIGGASAVHRPRGRPGPSGAATSPELRDRAPGLDQGRLSAGLTLRPPTELGRGARDQLALGGAARQGAWIRTTTLAGVARRRGLAVADVDTHVVRAARAAPVQDVAELEVVRETWVPAVDWSCETRGRSTPTCGTRPGPGWSSPTSWGRWRP